MAEHASCFDLASKLSRRTDNTGYTTLARKNLPTDVSSPATTSLDRIKHASLDVDSCVMNVRKTDKISAFINAVFAASLPDAIARVKDNAAALIRSSSSINSGGKSLHMSMSINMRTHRSSVHMLLNAQHESRTVSSSNRCGLLYFRNNPIKGRTADARRRMLGRGWYRNKLSNPLTM